jgi:hypothetical protein
MSMLETKDSRKQKESEANPVKALVHGDGAQISPGLGNATYNGWPLIARKGFDSVTVLDKFPDKFYAQFFIDPPVGADHETI